MLQARFGPLIGCLFVAAGGGSARALDFVQQVAPGVHLAGFADRYGSANCGWIELEDRTVLIDLPHGVGVQAFLSAVARTSSKPIRSLVLTSEPDPEDERVRALRNLHNSMGLYPEGSYLDLVGGRYEGHGPLERFGVEVVDAEHPVTRGVRDFFVADEQHTPSYDSKKVGLLLKNRSDQGTAGAAGWAYQAGKGRLCHLANGHTRESLDHPMFQRLMRNAVRWCPGVSDSR